MSMGRWLPAWIPLAVVALPLAGFSAGASSGAAQDDGDAGAGDKILLEDGRIVAAAVEEAGDEVTLKFAHGDVSIPRDMVQEIYYADLSRYVPENEEEKEKYAKGFVRYDGRWVTRARFESEMAKKRQAIEDRLAKVKEHENWRDALEKTSKHFRWKTNCAEEILDQYIEVFEAYYEFFAKQFKLPRTRKRTEVYVYRNRKEFQQISGAPYGALGFFRPAKEDLHFFHDRTAEELPLGVLFHEGNHLLVHLMNPEVFSPHWISEGMAEYYGASEVLGGKFEPGGIQNGRLAQIKADLEKDRRVSIEDLIRKSAYDSYTWGWSFVHYMMNNKKYSKRFRQYFDLLVRGKGVDRERHSVYSGSRSMTLSTIPEREQIELFKKTMKVKRLSDLEEGWYEYVKNELDFSPGEGFLEAGKKFYYDSKPDYKASLEWIDKAIQAGLDTAEAFAWRGKVCRRLKKTREAIEAYQDALDRAPLRASYYYELGRCHAQKKDAASKEEAKRLKLLAADLDPQGFGDVIDLADLISIDDD